MGLIYTQPYLLKHRENRELNKGAISPKNN